MSGKLKFYNFLIVIFVVVIIIRDIVRMGNKSSTQDDFQNMVH